jgi:hypothetical protein
VTDEAQAAVLAGLDVTMLIEFNLPADADWVHFVWIFHICSFTYITHRELPYLTAEE